MKVTLEVQTPGAAEALKKIATRSPAVVARLGELSETSKPDGELLAMLNNPFVKIKLGV